MSPRDGTISDAIIYFASSDCTGTGYVSGAYFFGGYVVVVYDITSVPGLYYLDKNSLPITDFSAGSYIFGAGGCVVQATQGLLVLPTFPNDPMVTGVSTSTYQIPIKIQSP